MATDLNGRIPASSVPDDRPDSLPSPVGLNPFIDPTGYVRERDLTEAMFQAVLAAQQKLAGK